MESLEKPSFIERSMATSGLTSVPIAAVSPLLLPWGLPPCLPYPSSKNFVTRYSTVVFFFSPLSGHSFSDSSFSSPLLERGCSPSYCLHLSSLQAHSPSLISSISWPSTLHLEVSRFYQHLSTSKLNSSSSFPFPQPLHSFSSELHFLFQF